MFISIDNPPLLGRRTNHLPVPKFPENRENNREYFINRGVLTCIA
jgi:hypothetical protein